MVLQLYGAGHDIIMWAIAIDLDNKMYILVVNGSWFDQNSGNPTAESNPTGAIPITALA